MRYPPLPLSHAIKKNFFPPILAKIYVSLNHVYQLLTDNLE